MAGRVAAVAMLERLGLSHEATNKIAGALDQNLYRIKDFPDL
jgi:hypothetical protein